MGLSLVDYSYYENNEHQLHSQENGLPPVIIIPYAKNTADSRGQEVPLIKVRDVGLLPGL